MEVMNVAGAEKPLQVQVFVECPVGVHHENDCITGVLKFDDELLEVIEYDLARSRRCDSLRSMVFVLAIKGAPDRCG